MKRAEIRRIFRHHRGAAADVARSANVGRNVVSQWLKGKTVSANVERHAIAKATELAEKQEVASHA